MNITDQQAKELANLAAGKELEWKVTNFNDAIWLDEIPTNKKDAAILHFEIDSIGNFLMKYSNGHYYPMKNMAAIAGSLAWHQEKIFNEQKALNIIKRIRESFKNSVEVYTSGSCYRFALILKEVFPKGEILTNQSHAIFEQYEDSCFDIQGRAKKTKNHIRLKELGTTKVFDLLSLIYDEQGIPLEKNGS